jgi:hypothetical protein
MEPILSPVGAVANRFGGMKLESPPAATQQHSPLSTPLVARSLCWETPAPATRPRDYDGTPSARPQRTPLAPLSQNAPFQQRLGQLVTRKVTEVEEDDAEPRTCPARYADEQLTVADEREGQPSAQPRAARRSQD